jgi:signal transduction histidine kinase
MGRSLVSGGAAVSGGRTLRRQLLLGYVAFVTALASLGAWSAWQALRLSREPRRIIAENYDSVVAAKDMKESLERMDSAALFLLLGRRDRAQPQLLAHRPRFDAAFERAAHNITEPGETELIAHIRAGRDDYYGLFAAFEQRPADAREAFYFGSLQPRFDGLRADCDRLLDLNQSAMRLKAAGATAVARRWFTATVAVAGALVAAGIALGWVLARAITEPVRRLTDAAARLAQGDLDVSVPVSGGSEMAALAAGFNTMARQLRALHVREVDRLKSEFVATASHELRTPLATLQMGVNLLLEGSAGALTAAQADVLATCRDEAARLERLIGELLDLTRLETAASAPHLLDVPAASLLREALEPLRLPVERKGLRLRVDLPSTLPAVRADRAQVERVLANLVTNAVRATERGEIAVSAAERDGGVAITVRDTGRGIPPEWLPRIFERFVQVPGAAAGGAGLGLAISQHIVRAHGGQLTARSEPGRGSEFTFTLPKGGGG